MNEGDITNNLLITSNLSVPNNDHKNKNKNKNEEYYLSTALNYPVLFDALIDIYNINITCNISSYLSAFDNDIFINCDEFFGCDKKYMWSIVLLYL